MSVNVSEPGGVALAPDRSHLQQLIEEIVDSGFLGITLRVRDRHSEWVGSAGLAELGGTAPPPIDGHFRIGSNTKPFTATLVLQLVAAGKLGLDDPVRDHLPEFWLDPGITVRMLLQHTSGVFNFSGEYAADGTVDPGIPIPYGSAGAEWVDLRFKTYPLEELARLALSKPARFAPGTSWSYSNTNYVLARLLIERVAGRPFAEVLQKLILEPLGMSGTVAPGAAPEIPDPHAHGYYRFGDPDSPQTIDVTRHNPSWNSSGGDMIATTGDLGTFVSGLLGGKLLPADLRTEMCTPHSTGIPDMGYGLGLFVSTTDGGATVVSHNGGTVGYAALMYGTPDGSRTLTAGLNLVDDAGMSLATAFQRTQRKLVGTVFDES